MEATIDILKRDMEKILVDMRREQCDLRDYKKKIKTIESRLANYELQKQSIEKTIEYLGGWKNEKR